MPGGHSQCAGEAGQRASGSARRRFCPARSAAAEHGVLPVPSGAASPVPWTRGARPDSPVPA